MAFPDIAARVEVAIINDLRPQFRGATGTVLGPAGNDKWIIRLQPPVESPQTTTTHLVVEAQNLEPLRAARSPPYGYYTLMEGDLYRVLRFTIDSQIWEVPVSDNNIGDEIHVGTFSHHPQDHTLAVQLEHNQTNFRYLSKDMAISHEGNLSLFKDEYIVL